MRVSLTSRVGTGKYHGVSTAICLEGPIACFWMWTMCIVGASSAFIERMIIKADKNPVFNGNAIGLDEENLITENEANIKLLY